MCVFGIQPSISSPFSQNIRSTLWPRKPEKCLFWLVKLFLICMTVTGSVSSAAVLNVHAYQWKFRNTYISSIFLCIKMIRGQIFNILVITSHTGDIITLLVTYTFLNSNSSYPEQVSEYLQNEDFLFQFSVSSCKGFSTSVSAQSKLWVILLHLSCCIYVC